MTPSLALPRKRGRERNRHTAGFSRPAIAQIQHFFEHYKDLEAGKWVKVLRWGPPEDAYRLIEEGIARAKK